MDGYAITREDGRVRIVVFDERNAPCATKVSNAELLDMIEYDCEDEFVVRGGMLVYEPLPGVLERREIAELKAKLVQTDYIAAKIAEGAATRDEYADELAERRAWRDRINELEAVVASAC